MADDFEPVDDFEPAPIPAPAREPGANVKPSTAPAPAEFGGFSGGLETDLIHMGRGIAGDWPARGAAALTATFGAKPEGESWSDRYDKAMGVSDRVARKSAEENPIAAGTSEFVGAVAPYVAGGGFIKGGASLAGQAARAAGIGGLHGAATGGPEGALAGAAFGSILPGLAGAGTGAKVASVALPAALSAPTLVDPNATAAQKVTAAETALFPLAAHVAGSRGRAGIEKDTAASRARTEVRGAAEKALTDESKAIDTQRAEIDRQNMARVRDAEAAEAQTLGQIEGVNANAERAGKAAIARESQAARSATKQGLDARAEAFGETKRAYNEAREAARAKAKAENDQHRLNQLDADDAWDARVAQYEKDQTLRRSFLEQQNARNEEVTKRARTLKDIDKEKTRLQNEYKRKQEEVESDFKAALEGIDVDAASIPSKVLGRIGEMFRETHTRLANLHAGAQRNGLTLPKRYADVDQYVTETLLKNTPRKIAELEEYKADPKAWIEKQIAAEKGKIATAPEQTLPEAPPDFDVAAREAVAERAQAAADLDARARAAAEASVPALATPEVPEPVAPDRTTERAAKRDWVRQRILAEPEPLPPKADPIAKASADRIDRAALDAALANLRGRTGRQAPIDSMVDPKATRPVLPTYENVRGAARSDPSLLLDKPDRLVVDDNMVADRARQMVDAGRENVRYTMTDRGVPEERSIASQRFREKLASLIPDIPVGHAARRMVARTMGDNGGELARYTATKLGDAAKGERSGYAKPAEAAAIFEDEGAAVGQTARDLASPGARWLKAAGGSPGTSQALAAILASPEFTEWLRTRTSGGKEEASTATPSLSGTGLPGGALVNPRIGLEVEKVLTDPETRAKLEEALKRYKIGMGASTPVIP